MATIHPIHAEEGNSHYTLVGQKGKGGARSQREIKIPKLHMATTLQKIFILVRKLALNDHMLPLLVASITTLIQAKFDYPLYHYLVV